MSLTVNWTDRDQGIIVIATGNVVDRDFIQMHQSIIADPRQRSSRYHLLDATYVAHIDFSTANVRECVEQAKIAFAANPQQVIAIVTTSSLGFGLSRMWQIYLDLSGVYTENNIFNERELAEQWIREVTREKWFEFK
jgi:hypothetical protein